MFALITWGTWPKLRDAWTHDEITGTPGVFVFLIWPFLAVIVLGAAVTAVEFVIQCAAAARRAAAAWRGPSPWVPLGAALGLAALLAACVALLDLTNAQLGLLGVACMMLLLVAGLPIGVTIYGGIFTPTESGAAGALGALLIALARRRLGWRRLWNTMVETGYVTVSILFLILGARIFGQMLAMSGLPQGLSALAAGAGFGLEGFVLLYIALAVVLGCMLDSVSIMVITLPFAIPVVKALGGDLIWFGVVAVVAVEIGLLTPPFGISVYVVKSTLDDQRIALRDIFAGAAPFVVCMLTVTLLLLFVPQLSLLFK